MRSCLWLVALAIVATWAYLVISFVFGSGSQTDEAEFRRRHSGPSQIPEDVTGWQLLERLYMVGVKDPTELARLLEEQDPLKVSVSSPDKFQCPQDEAERFSYPDVRNHVNEDAFKKGNGFIYYQHLRKAGGTGFCEMAGRNMVKTEVPRYHCMPDNRGGMATPPWSNQDYLLQQMKANRYRITANEWDAFPSRHLSLPEAVFATTFRHPVDRWYSQYRFEHVEHRDGTKQGSVSLPFDAWYRRVKPYVMGDNYYVKTFCGRENPSDENLMKDVNLRGKPKHARDLLWSYHKFNDWGEKVSWYDFRAAIENLRRFNLILVLDFVDDEMWALEEALGWKQARKQVLPHERQAVRVDKKSIPAREALSAEVWADSLRTNVFDLLLFHWAKRMYLERSACRAPR